MQSPMIPIEVRRAMVTLLTQLKLVDAPATRSQAETLRTSQLYSFRAIP